MFKLQDQTQNLDNTKDLENNKCFENKRLSHKDQRTMDVWTSLNKGFKTPAAQRFSTTMAVRN